MNKYCRGIVRLYKNLRIKDDVIQNCCGSANALSFVHEMNPVYGVNGFPGFCLMQVGTTDDPRYKEYTVINNDPALLKSLNQRFAWKNIDKQTRKPEFLEMKSGEHLAFEGFLEPVEVYVERDDSNGSTKKQSLHRFVYSYFNNKKNPVAIHHQGHTFDNRNDSLMEVNALGTPTHKSQHSNSKEHSFSSKAGRARKYDISNPSQDLFCKCIVPWSDKCIDCEAILKIETDEAFIEFCRIIAKPYWN